MLELNFIRTLWAMLSGRLGELRRNEAGYSTEAVMITALLAALAIAAIAIISVKVLAKANDIQTS